MESHWICCCFLVASRPPTTAFCTRTARGVMNSARCFGATAAACRWVTRCRMAVWCSRMAVSATRVAWNRLLRACCSTTESSLSPCGACQRERVGKCFPKKKQKNKIPLLFAEGLRVRTPPLFFLSFPFYCCWSFSALPQSTDVPVPTSTCKRKSVVIYSVFGDSIHSDLSARDRVVWVCY